MSSSMNTGNNPVLPTPTTLVPSGKAVGEEDHVGVLVGVIVFTVVIICAIIALMILALIKLRKGNQNDEEADIVSNHSNLNQEMTEISPKPTLTQIPSVGYDHPQPVCSPVFTMTHNPLSQTNDLSNYARPPKISRPVTNHENPLQSLSDYDYLPSPKPVESDYDHPSSPRPVDNPHYDYLRNSPRRVESNHPLSEETVESDYANLPVSNRSAKSAQHSNPNTPTPSARRSKNPIRPSFKSPLVSVKTVSPAAFDDEPIYSNTWDN